MSLDRYIARSMRSVVGYLSTLDAQLIATLLSVQDRENIPGHLCEIGVHHGRLFFLLALARRSGERALAIDIFEDDAMTANTSHAGRDRGLFVNADRLGIPLSDDEIVKSSSLDVQPVDIRARTAGGIRFFSVDGCHYRRFVENDVQLAAQTVSGPGIIAIDDFFNIDWPDVTAVTCELLQRTDTLVPFALTRSKLYVAAPAAAERYRSALRQDPRLPKTSTAEFLGREVITARNGAWQRGYDALRGMISGCSAF